MMSNQTPLISITSIPLDTPVPLTTDNISIIPQAEEMKAPATTPQTIDARAPGATPVQIATIPQIPPPLLPKADEINLVPGKGQELQTTLGTVMVPASQKGHPKITHIKDIEYQGKKTHVFVITMEEEEESPAK
jgi:hypothetical protein